MKSILIIFAGFLMIVVTNPFYQLIDNLLTDDITQSFNTVVTPAGQTSVNITLSVPLYNDSISNVVEISSNISSDTPTAYYFNTVSYALEVSGLSANETRTLSAEVLTDTDNLDLGFNVFWETMRWLWVLIMLALFGGSIYAFFD